jgi:hypothetical protein
MGRSRKRSMMTYEEIADVQFSPSELFPMAVSNHDGL